MSKPKNIVLGVSGSIAAHKAIDLASLLAKAGCEVDVVLTRDAQQFVKPLPFQTLTNRPVITSLYDEATANTLAKLALGLADDALGCVALALRPEAKLLVAPAMNGKMWRHPATEANVATLVGRGAEIIGPDDGMLSCGYDGIGRLWPVDGIAAHALKLLGVESADD